MEIDTIGRYVVESIGQQNLTTSWRASLYSSRRLRPYLLFLDISPIMFSLLT